MSQIFISYSRHCKTIAESLANDIRRLGFAPWLDQELSGGKVWWDQILEQIRECDIFVFVLAQSSLDSIACRREHEYAAELGKTILPVLVADDISLNLLPPSLAKIHYVDYRNPDDRNTVFLLNKAIENSPKSEILPDPLPPPPDVPISYLGQLAAKVESTTTLNFSEQTELLIELKSGLKETETKDDSLRIIEKFRKRRDLFASIDRELQEIIQSAIQKPNEKTKHERFRSFKKKFTTEIKEPDIKPTIKEKRQNSAGFFKSIQSNKWTIILFGISLILIFLGAINIKTELFYFVLLAGVLFLQFSVYIFLKQKIKYSSVIIILFNLTFFSSFAWLTSDIAMTGRMPIAYVYETTQNDSIDIWNQEISAIRSSIINGTATPAARMRLGYLQSRISTASVEVNKEVYRKEPNIFIHFFYKYGKETSIIFLSLTAIVILTNFLKRRYVSDPFKSSIFTTFLNAVNGYCLLSAFLLIICLIFEPDWGSLPMVFITGITGAVAGFLSGGQPKIIRTIIYSIPVCWVLVILFSYIIEVRGSYIFFFALTIGTAVGTLFGSILGATLKRKKGWE